MAQALDQTVSKTGKLKPTKEKVIPKIRDEYFTRNINKFYKKDRLYKEKNTFGIDTRGEFEGITVKGWLAKKRKARLR